MSAATDRYARAIFELAVEAGQVSQVSAELDRVADAYQVSRELRNVLSNPVVSAGDRKAVIDTLARKLGLSTLAGNAVRVIALRRRTAIIPELATRLRRLADIQAGMLRVTVTMAGPPPDYYCRALAVQIEKATGKKVVIEKEQDPSLIAGVVARIGDRTIDGSVRGRLREMERRLLQVR